MSNHEAGKLYEAVIEEVINDSRQDFEESGIDEGTLQELKRLWSERLSQTRVCNFTWDDSNAGYDPMMTSSSVHELSLSMGPGLTMSNLAYNTTAAMQNGVRSSPSSAFPMGLELPNVKPEYSDDSGLILPKINQVDGLFELTMDADDSAKQLVKKLRKKVTQTDGNALEDEDDDDNDIFNDSDDINLDLDDDLDSEKSDEDDAEQEDQIMLCLYDKVQRVKNKWKCNLKEGVANIDGRDYVFQRATGESEW